MLPSIWNPLRDLSRFDRDFDALFGRPLYDEANDAAATWYPTVEILEVEGDGYKILASVPGVKKEDIKVEVENNVLTISGERKEEKEEKKGEKVIRRESFYGRFARSFRLPDMVDGAKIGASYKDGVLTVIVPKSEAAKPRKVAVNVG